MSPELKYHSYVVTITTAVVFSIWILLSKIIPNNPKTLVLISALTSLGTYKAIATMFLALARRWEWLKKLILGPHYLEGTWVGFFVGNDNSVRFIVETFEQDFLNIVIRGSAYTCDGVFHGSWTAANASFDSKISRLSYTYEADMANNAFINSGIATFQASRPSLSSAPTILIGYSSDLFNPKKLLGFERKLEANRSLDTNTCINGAIEVLRDFYKQAGLPESIMQIISKHQTREA